MIRTFQLTEPCATGPLFCLATRTQDSMKGRAPRIFGLDLLAKWYWELEMAAFRKSPGVAVLLEVGDCNTASRSTHT